MADTLLFAQLQPTTLAGAGSSIGDTTITLSSFETIDGVALAMTDLGSIAYATIEPNNGTSEEQVSFTGITQNGNGTATLTGVKTVLMLAPYTETSGLAKSHIGGAKFVISNTAGFYNKMTSKANDETITGLYTFTQTPIIPVAAPTLDTEVANKKYVDDTATFGAPDMTQVSKGIGQEASAAQINAGTQTGSLGGDTIVNPKYLKDSIYYTQLPSSDQKAALAGSGTPSAANKFVTADTDALKELLSNKSTDTALGSSNTLYPSQLAVKTYVDAYSPTTKNGTITRALDAANGAVTTAHGLGRIPKKVKITGVVLSSGSGAVLSIGSYDGTNNSCVYFAGNHGNTSVNPGKSDTVGVYLYVDTSDGSGVASAVITCDATNITLTWTKAGTPDPTGTAYIMWEVQ